MTYQELVLQVSKELNLPLLLIMSTYRNYWRFIKDSIQALPLKEELTEEEYDKLRTNFNIPSLGKLSCTRQRYLNMKKNFEFIKKLKDAES